MVGPTHPPRQQDLLNGAFSPIQHSINQFIRFWKRIIFRMADSNATKSSAIHLSNTSDMFARIWNSISSMRKANFASIGNQQSNAIESRFTAPGEVISKFQSTTLSLFLLWLFKKKLGLLSYRSSRFFIDNLDWKHKQPKILAMDGGFQPSRR